MLSDLVIALLALPALLPSGYLFLLTVASRRPAPPPSGPTRWRFAVVVPAHDEEAGIARTVESLRAMDWPRDRFEVLVVADNCGDATAERARAAGAEVLVRTDSARRGKGFALEFAFQRILERGQVDAAVVVDADSEASPGLLVAFAARLEAGAHALQGSYRVLNPLASWRTRLMAVALALVNDVRSLGRERLGLSCGLKGNGMCFSAEALRRVPHRAFSIVEDLEYGIQLAEAGMRVHYVWEGCVRGEMVSGEVASRSQRQRWEGGRLAMARSRALPLLRLALSRRDPVLLDLAIDLLVPPLAQVGVYLTLGSVTMAAFGAAGLVGGMALAPWVASGLFLSIYVLRGVQMSGLGVRGVAALAWAPAYAAWKLTALHPGQRQPKEWVRTTREQGNGVRPEERD